MSHEDGDGTAAKAEISEEPTAAWGPTAEVNAELLTGRRFRVSSHVQRVSISVQGVHLTV